MKNSSKIIDFLAPKNGKIRPFKGGVTVWWHNGKFQMLFDNLQLKELLDDGSLRYRFVE